MTDDRNLPNLAADGELACHLLRKLPPVPQVAYLQIAYGEPIFGESTGTYVHMQVAAPARDLHGDDARAATIAEWARALASVGYDTITYAAVATEFVRVGARARIGRIDSTEPSVYLDAWTNLSPLAAVRMDLTDREYIRAGVPIPVEMLEHLPPLSERTTT